MPQKKSNIYKTNLSILAIALMAVITVASMFVYNGLINRTFKADTAGNTYYTYHFALVAEAHDDPFWINVWTAANKEANRMDACVEWIGHSLAEQYPLTDQLEMAMPRAWTASSSSRTVRTRSRSSFRMRSTRGFRHHSDDRFCG